MTRKHTIIWSVAAALFWLAAVACRLGSLG